MHVRNGMSYLKLLLVPKWINNHNLRGGGVHPDFFVKLDLEIAIDQQTKACDQTFEGVPDSECPPVPAGQPRPFLVQIMPNYAKSP